MQVILPDILTLKQYLQLPIEAIKPSCCPHCGCAALHYHGHYSRKVDRGTESDSLNPIPIHRFACQSCYTTCSVLPECIPPLRWYLWSIQVLVLRAFIGGLSINAASNASNIHRSTCRCWLQSWKDHWLKQAHALRTYLSELGRYQSFNAFWGACLSAWPLSKAMRLCHEQGVTVL